MLSHDELRQRNRKLRAALDSKQLAAAAEKLSRRILVLDEYRQAKRIAAYFAVNGEIDLNPVIDHALAAGKQVYLPNLDRQALRFSPYFHGQKMRVNKFRLPEPDVGDDEMLAPAELDLVRNRIGMGGGYYDRSFEFRKQADISKPTLIGVAHEIQKVDKLVPQAWDVRLDMVLTDEAQYAG
jgi:5-formyltetrahydrofolate cyclo-ligase